MKTYKIIKLSTIWSLDPLIEKVEKMLNEMTQNNWEVVSVSFGVNVVLMPTAFITLSKLST